MADLAGGAARRRNERQLRSWLRHERMTVRMELAAARRQSAEGRGRSLLRRCLSRRGCPRRLGARTLVCLSSPCRCWLVATASTTHCPLAPGSRAQEAAERGEGRAGWSMSLVCKSCRFFQFRSCSSSAWSSTPLSLRRVYPIFQTVRLTWDSPVASNGGRRRCLQAEQVHFPAVAQRQVPWSKLFV